MGEREPKKETIGKGELYFLWHPGTENVFSGYGLSKGGSKGLLVGVLMVDRPQPVDPEWLNEIEKAFGEYQLVPMTATGERGLLCQMQIEENSLTHLRQLPTEKAAAIQKALEPLLDEPPRPTFRLHWDEEAGLWKSRIDSSELPIELKEVFEKTGYGCLAVESNIGVIHVCHAADADIEGFAGKPVRYQWQLIEMPSAPLIRFVARVHDRPGSPYQFESFLNVAEDDQAQVLAELAGQDKIYLAFYGDDFTHKFTKILQHDEQQWQYLDELVAAAKSHWDKIPPEKRDFDRAKADFMSRYV